MQKKILIALILLIILVIIVVWKRWYCLECGAISPHFEFKVPHEVTPNPPTCDCKCISPANDVPQCNSHPRVWICGGDVDTMSISNGDLHNLMRMILEFATWNSLGDGTHKFLWVESKSTPTLGKVTSANVLPTLGLTLGTDYDWVDGSEFATVNLNLYTAIATASSNTGMLTSTELNALQTRSLEISDYAKQGGGFVVFPETTTGAYQWLPFSISSSLLQTTSGYSATASGSLFGLTSLTMEYQHEVVFDSYDLDVLIPAEKNGINVTSLMSDPNFKDNPCLDRKATIVNYGNICGH